MLRARQRVGIARTLADEMRRHRIANGILTREPADICSTGDDILVATGVRSVPVQFVTELRHHPVERVAQGCGESRAGDVPGRVRTTVFGDKVISAKAGALLDFR